jgi:tetratricopeptide (TPR) repeat protein
MSYGALFDPDHPRWRGDQNHTDKVSRRLKAAFRHIGRGQHDPYAYVKAHHLAALCVNERRSTHQNMLVNLAMGLALGGMQSLVPASAALDLALDDAYTTEDFAAAIETYEHLGEILRCQGHYEDAARFYEEGLEILEAHGGAALLTSPRTLRFQLGLAISRMAIGLYEDALLPLRLASALARRAGDALLQGAVDLTMANIHTARGNAHAALPLCLAARDSHLDLGAQATPSRLRMQGRFHAIAALGLLDVVEVYARNGQDVRRHRYVEKAGSFAQQALNHVADTNEPGAHYMGLIANARYKRLSGRLPSAVHLLQPLLTDVEQLGDPALAIQIHVAIAEDYAARDKQERARAHYQRAYRTANEAGVAHLGEPALRALLA